METKVFDKREISALKLGAIAEKHGCSSNYVRYVLTGVSKRNTVLARKILMDAIDMLEVLERDTKVTM